jgi:hypothetical protein
LQNHSRWFWLGRPAHMAYRPYRATATANSLPEVGLRSLNAIRLPYENARQIGPPQPTLRSTLALANATNLPDSQRPPLVHRLGCGHIIKLRCSSALRARLCIPRDCC